MKTRGKFKYEIHAYVILIEEELKQILGKLLGNGIKSYMKTYWEVFPESVARITEHIGSDKVLFLILGVHVYTISGPGSECDCRCGSIGMGPGAHAVTHLSAR